MANAKNRYDRRASITRMDLAGKKEQVSYSLTNDGANLSVLPALGSNFPEVSFSIQMRKKGPSSPISNPVTEGWRGYIEYQGQTFAVVALHLHSWEFYEGYETPAIVVAFDGSGKEVARLETAQNDSQFYFSAIRLKIAMERAGENLGAGTFKTTCSGLDPVELTQSWSAVINPPSGLQSHRVGGDAKDLRRAGIDPLKYNHFRSGRYFSSHPAPGQAFTYAIVEQADGKWISLTWYSETGALDQAAVINFPDMAFSYFAGYENLS
ncbi:MAG: hypothetical protein JNN28_12505 [Saprospiraceae bacterium]|nr:hypothetical protein [Saprospiraceae bacterium]